MSTGRNQLCYAFRLDGNDETIYHAVTSHFRVENEGRREDLFDAPEREKENESFKEPSIKWGKSKAKGLLYERILDGSIPLNPEDSLMTLEEIYSVEAEFHKYQWNFVVMDGDSEKPRKIGKPDPTPKLSKAAAMVASQLNAYDDSDEELPDPNLS